jgi:hypothetical protein
MPLPPSVSITELCQDYILLAGVRSPGVCIIRGAGSPRHWDEREGYGTSGATTVWMGAKLARFEVELQITELSDLIDFAPFALLLVRPPAGIPPIAYGISHPLLNLPPISISDVVIEDVSQWEEDEYGLFTMKIKFLEYKRPMAALAASPAAAIPSDGVAPPTAKDAQDLQIDALTAELEAIPVD